MRDGACLINTARGDLIDETALHQELTNGRLFACLDVFSEEPYKGPISNRDRNVVALSPHIASTCCDFLKGCRKDLDVFLESLTVC